MRDIEIVRKGMENLTSELAAVEKHITEILNRTFPEKVLAINI